MAFLYPSLYEGFGYPLIESMSKGAIPIASKTSCIPEVLGNAGFLVEPSCFESLAKAVYRIIEEKKLRDSLKKINPKIAKIYIKPANHRHYQSLQNSLL